MADDRTTDYPGAPLDDVRERVEAIQRAHRGKIRWRITKHTAEIAIRAIESDRPRGLGPTRSGKSRRRKRFKRLL